MTQTHLPPPSVARMLAMSSARQATTVAPKARSSAPVIRHGEDECDTSIHTALVTLSPDYLDALRGVAPKKTRRSKVPYVIALAVLAVLAVLGGDRSTREFGIAKGRQIAARFHGAPAAKPVDAPAAAVAQAATPAPSAFDAAPAVQLDEPAVAPVVVTAPAAKKATKASSAVRSKKAESRPAVRQAAKRPTAMLAAQISGAK